MFAFAIAAAAVLIAAQPTAPAPAPLAQAGSFSAEYDVGAIGLHGTFGYSFKLAGPAYQSTAQRRMDGLARLLVKKSQDYTYVARGAVDAGGLAPSIFEQRGGKHGRLVHVDFSAQDVVTTATPPVSVSPGAPTRADKLGSLDLVSFFVAMTINHAPPCTQVLKVFDGRALFKFAMEPAGRQAVSTKAWRGSAYRCRVHYIPIAGFRDPQHNTDLTFLFAPLPNGWLAPITIQLPGTDIGTVTLEARRLTVSAE
jgi:hypothetical protein